MYEKSCVKDGEDEVLDKRHQAAFDSSLRTQWMSFSHLFSPALRFVSFAFGHGSTQLPPPHTHTLAPFSPITNTPPERRALYTHTHARRYRH